MKEIPAFYQYLQFTISTHSLNKGIHKDILLSDILRGFNIPQKLRKVILEEMKAFGLIKECTKEHIITLDCPFEDKNQCLAQLTNRRMFNSRH